METIIRYYSRQEIFSFYCAQLLDDECSVPCMMAFCKSCHRNWIFLYLGDKQKDTSLCFGLPPHFQKLMAYSTQPHNYSFQIIAQVLDIKSLLSPVVLWAQRQVYFENLVLYYFCLSTHV